MRSIHFALITVLACLAWTGTALAGADRSSEHRHGGSYSGAFAGASLGRIARGDFEGADRARANAALRRFLSTQKLAPGADGLDFEIAALDVDAETQQATILFAQRIDGIEV